MQPTTPNSLTLTDYNIFDVTLKSEEIIIRNETQKKKKVEQAILN